MSTIAVRMADGAPGIIAVAGFAGQLANRNVDMAEMPKHSLVFLPLISAALLAEACALAQAIHPRSPPAFRRGRDRCARYRQQLVPGNERTTTTRPPLIVVWLVRSVKRLIKALRNRFPS